MLYEILSCDSWIIKGDPLVFEPCMSHRTHQGTYLKTARLSVDTVVFLSVLFTFVMGAVPVRHYILPATNTLKNRDVHDLKIHKLYHQWHVTILWILPHIASYQITSCTHTQPYAEKKRTSPWSDGWESSQQTWKAFILHRPLTSSFWFNHMKKTPFDF